MAYEIIMPVLGMSQDTGIIAGWCKSLGDYVNAGEAIMEVETDKAIQEIAAAESGYLSKIFHQQDANVPVGEVVGLLTAEKPDNLNEEVTPQPPSETATSSALPPDNASPKDTVLSQEIPDTERPPLKKDKAAQTTDSTAILASAKARAAAHKQQLSLADVSAVINKSPLHAADITAYLDLPKQHQTPQSSMAQSMHPAALAGIQMAFRVNRSGLKHCENWLAKQLPEGDRLTSSHLIATLASALWRQIFSEKDSDPVTIDVECITGEGFNDSQLSDADLERFSKLEVITESSKKTVPADLQLIDLRHSTLCEYLPVCAAQPLLLIAQEKKQIKVSLYGIAMTQNLPALRFMDALARQLEEPMLYIA